MYHNSFLIFSLNLKNWRWEAISICAKDGYVKTLLTAGPSNSLTVLYLLLGLLHLAQNLGGFCGGDRLGDRFTVSSCFSTRAVSKNVYEKGEGVVEKCLSLIDHTGWRLDNASSPQICFIKTFKERSQWWPTSTWSSTSLF